MRRNESVATERIAGPIPFYDADGNLLTGQTFSHAAHEVAVWNSDTGAFADASADAVEVTGTGEYYVPLSQAEVNHPSFVVVRLKKATYADRLFNVPIESVDKTRVTPVVPDQLSIPGSGTRTYRIEILIYGSDGSMRAPDAAPTLTLVNQAGTDESSRLDSTTMTIVGAEVGHYRSVYTSTAGDDPDELVWTFSVVVQGITRLYGACTVTNLTVPTVNANVVSIADDAVVSIWEGTGATIENSLKAADMIRIIARMAAAPKTDFRTNTITVMSLDGSKPSIILTVDDSGVLTFTAVDPT